QDGSPASPFDRGDQHGNRPANLGELVVPAGHQLADRDVALDGPGVPGGDVAGPIARLVPSLDRLADLSRPLGVDLEDIVGDPDDAPMTQPAGRTVVRDDGVAKFDRDSGGRGTTDDGGGVEVLP